MIEWLCKAFGFEKHAVYTDGDVVQHAQSDEVGGRGTQCCCIVVSDCAAHYARAKAGGAEIVDEFETRDHGGSGYGCRDPESHLWFGDYHPWADQPT
jgi:uncharacterized glyoxalase superfamily protein PhnB